MPTREYRADLHIHTVLSACAEVEMIPPLIVDAARRKGLDLIAITDHNATTNVAAVMEAARGTDLTVLPGMEFQSQEEVELLCIFDDLEQAARWQAEVTAHLLPLKNDPDRFGPQFVVDAQGDFVEEATAFYQGPAQIPLADAADRVRALGGLIVPAHIERPTKGLLGVLGLWPPNLAVDAASLRPGVRPSEARRRHPFLEDIPLITCSDAHWLDAVGQVMTIFTLMGPPGVSELRRALQKVEQRDFCVP